MVGVNDCITYKKRESAFNKFVVWIASFNHSDQRCFVTKTANPLLSSLAVLALCRHASGKEDARNLPQLLPFSTNPGRKQSQSWHRESTSLRVGHGDRGINDRAWPSAAKHPILSSCHAAQLVCCWCLQLQTLSLCTLPLAG